MKYFLSVVLIFTNVIAQDIPSKDKSLIISGDLLTNTTDDIKIISAWTGTIIAINLSDLSILWTLDIIQNKNNEDMVCQPSLTPPEIIDNFISTKNAILIVSDYSVYAVDIINGKVIWNFDAVSCNVGKITKWNIGENNLISITIRDSSNKFCEIQNIEYINSNINIIKESCDD